MFEQFGPIYWQNPSEINKPSNNTYVRLFRSLLDGFYYIKKFDGTVEPFVVGSASNGATPVTYAALQALIAGNALVVGAPYLITDFRTRHIIPHTAVVNTGPIEPLIVTASSTNEINTDAFSSSFNQDELLYEINDSTTAGGDRGRIFYRRDTEIDVSSWYDWRVVLFRRWDDGLGNFTVITDNGNAFLDFYTFNNSNIAAATTNIELDQITDFGIIAFGCPTDKLNNTIIVSPSLHNYIEADNFNNTIIAAIFAGNRIAPVFSGNTLNGGSIVLNYLNVVFENNNVGANFLNNVIGQRCSNNSIGDDFHNNIIGEDMASNTIGDAFSTNDISTGFAANIVGDNFNDNVLGTASNGNNIGNSFQRNRIQDGFASNIILDDFNNNIIAGAFTSNINIQNNFQFNTISEGLSGFDFALATNVYGFYSKIIFRNSVATFRLSYVDGADTVIYGAPNS